MPCNLDQVDALLDGTLPQEQREAVLSHIHSCPACRMYYEAVSGLEGSALPPADFTARVMEAVRTTPQERVKRRLPLRRYVSGLAACAVVVLGVSLWLSAGSGNQAAIQPADAPRIGTENVVPYDSGTDSQLPLYSVTDSQLCAQIRQWMQQENISQTYPQGPREAYDLTAAQAAALCQAIPALELPERDLQLELSPR